MGKTLSVGDKKRIWKFVLLLLAAQFLFTSVVGIDTYQNLIMKWKATPNKEISRIYVGDVDADNRNEVVISFYSNNILVFNESGNLKKNLSLDSLEGRIYFLTQADVNHDGLNENIVGVGGIRDDKTFNLHEYDVVEEQGKQTMVWKTKVLYKRMRNRGEVRVYDQNFTRILWNYSTNDSVRSIFVGDLDGDYHAEVIAGTGDFGLDTYNERTGVDANGTEIWELIEYPIRDGTIYVLNENGTLLWKRTVELIVWENGKFVSLPTDNIVRVVYAADLNNSLNQEIIAGSNNNLLYVFNRTNDLLYTYNITAEVRTIQVADLFKDKQKQILVGSSGNMIYALDKYGRLLWKDRIDGVVTGISVVDLAEEGINDIVVSSRDGNLYVFDGNGVLKWKYYIGEDVYHMQVMDLDNNGREDIILSSGLNATVLEVSEYYVKGHQAAAYYLKAEDLFNMGDYTLAAIYAQKARALFVWIGDSNGMSDCDLLTAKINEENKMMRKREADLQYDKALKFYSMNNYTLAVAYAQEAKAIYTSVNDADGISKSDSLIVKIESEVIENRKIEADGYYSKAVSYFGFSNFTAALQNVREAKEIYVELNVFGGIAKCDLLISKIAGAEYNKAESLFNTEDYSASLEFVQEAKALYIEINDYNGTVKSDVLMSKINEKLREGGVKRPQPERSYTVYVVAAVALIAIAAFIIRKRMRASGGEETGV